jgi:RNA polymerase sigma-70 factor (ECF subfamily)
MPGRPVEIDADILAGELSESLQVSLEELDVTTREMILLRYFGEMSFKELADIFECPIGTVLARVHRGLKALRKIMKRK